MVNKYFNGVYLAKSFHMSRREWSHFSALAVRVCEEADGSGQEVLRGKQEWSKLDRSGQGGLQE